MHKFENILSAKGKYWKVEQPNQNYVMAASQKHGISNLLARILSIRGIGLHDIPDFLEPRLKNYLPDPHNLKDMENATTRICHAILNSEKIAIYGDYDVDGASATALLTRYFRMIGIEPEIYIPDRMKEGYGINTEALLKLKANNVALVITVDCGITAFEPISEAKKAGLDVVVIDHHLSAETFPEAVAIVNPNRFDDTSGLNNLCAAGVGFLLLVALNKALREKNFFATRTEPDLLSLLDLVALGTVCDVMTLNGLNRAYVAQGLKIFAARRNNGIAAIADIAGMNSKADVYALGFIIGPRINAAGRLGDCSLGARMLASEDPSFIKETAEVLNRLNKERQEIEKKTIEEATRQAEKQNESGNPLIMAQAENWHPGVIGIVAGRLKEKYNKPVAVIATKDGIGKASARSVRNVDLGSAIVAAKADDLLLAGGGHKAAAGFTVEVDKIKNLYEFLCERMVESYGEYLRDNDFRAELVLKVSSINMELVNEIEKLGPFGTGNPEPYVIIEDAKIVKSKIVGEKHLQCYIAESGLARNSATIKGVCFNSIDTDLGDSIQANIMKNASVAGKLRKNLWNGAENIEFMIEDIVTY